MLRVAAILFLLCALSYGQTSTQLEAPKTGIKTPAPAVERLDTPLSEAKSLVDNGMLKEADQAVRQYLGKHSNSADAHFLLGYILFKEIQAGASLEGQAEVPMPHDAGAQDSKLREVKAKASLAEYTEGAKYHDPSALDLKIVALDYVLLHDYIDADKWLTRSLAWNPEDAEGWYYLGRTKYYEGRLEEAITVFKECLKLDAKNVKAEDNLGLSYAGLGRAEEATTAFQEAIVWQAQMLTKNPGPFIDLGALLLEQNRVEEATSYLLEAAEISPQEFKSHELLGKAYSRLNQLRKAQDELEKAVELAPQNARLHFILGQIYRKEGLKEKAKLEFDRFTVLNGNHSSPQGPDR